MKFCILLSAMLIGARATGDVPSSDTTSSSCESYQFTCSNDACIPDSWSCDGFSDCSDGSDESGCASPTTCTYSISNNAITCGTQTCSTKLAGGNGPIPTGSYRIGQVTRQGTWFNLHPRKHDNHNAYWDYHAYNPDKTCRGGFAIHRSGSSEGCIVPQSTTCFDSLKSQIIEGNTLKTMSTTTCRTEDCQPGSCSHEIPWGQRSYYTDLTVTN